MNLLSSEQKSILKQKIQTSTFNELHLPATCDDQKNGKVWKLDDRQFNLATQAYFRFDLDTDTLDEIHSHPLGLYTLIKTFNITIGGLTVFNGSGLQMGIHAHVRNTFTTPWYIDERACVNLPWWPACNNLHRYMQCVITCSFRQVQLSCKPYERALCTYTTLSSDERTIIIQYLQDTTTATGTLHIKNLSAVEDDISTSIHNMSTYQYQSKQSSKTSLCTTILLCFSKPVYQLLVVFMKPNCQFPFSLYQSSDPDPFSEMKLHFNEHVLNQRTDPEGWLTQDKTNFNIPCSLDLNVYTHTFHPPPNYLHDDTALICSTTPKWAIINPHKYNDEVVLEIIWREDTPINTKAFVWIIDYNKFCIHSGTCYPKYTLC